MANFDLAFTCDAIIIGGSYAGLAAGLALGRARRRTLIVDDGTPCNARAARSHNFLAHDGAAPRTIATTARRKVDAYPSVAFVDGTVSAAWQGERGFAIRTAAGAVFAARALVLATGIEDKLPPIPGLAECWGISALHCPYCHGYEVRDRPTAVLAGGEAGAEFAALVANWTDDVALVTPEHAGVPVDAARRLASRGIRVVAGPPTAVEHRGGVVSALHLAGGSLLPVEVVYVRPPFEQRFPASAWLGCRLTAEGYLDVDAGQRTSVAGVFACGDSASPMRTLANAVATGAAAGMAVNRELVLEDFGAE